MKEYRIIFESKDKQYRIIEVSDNFENMANLKGDCFEAKHNPDIAPELLIEEEKAFEALVEREGCFGYILEKWNPEPGIGFEHVDSCWGFVGSYSETEEKFKHYIVEELMEQIPKGNKK